MTEDDHWQIEYGNGGWVRATSNTFDGWLYLRLALDRRRPLVRELYYDGRDGELGHKILRDLPLTNLIAFILDGEMAWLEKSIARPGANLALLASHFATDFGRGARHWVADSMRSQVTGSNVPSPSPGKEPPTRSAASAPAPLQAPQQGLTDAFLRAVAANYAWALRRGLRPAPELARMTGHSPRTVHGWVAKARDRGIMPPAPRKGSS